MNFSSLTIEEIWSRKTFEECAFEIWRRHLEWLELLGFDRAHERIAQQPDLFVQGTSHHEVVDLLARFIAETGFVNAHLGLTSSDVTDNVRLAQVSASVRLIQLGMWDVVRFVNERFNHDVETVAYTHLVPAAPITWRHRKDAWISPLMRLSQTPPVIYAKKFGGPVGDARALKQLIPLDKYEDNPFDWSFLDLDYPSNPYPLQSSDHHCEMSAVNWAIVVAAQLHKIALDLRQLYAFGHVVILPQCSEAGSSSMPHKINPYRLEKVCSMCRAVAATAPEMWSVAAQNGLERTLDTSWQIKQLLPRCFITLRRALNEFVQVNIHVDHIRCTSDFVRLRRQLGSDLDLMQRVKNGQDRWSAYQQMLTEKESPSLFNNNLKSTT